MPAGLWRCQIVPENGRVESVVRIGAGCFDKGRGLMDRRPGKANDENFWTKEKDCANGSDLERQIKTFNLIIIQSCVC